MIKFTDLRLTAASASEAATGLLAYVSITVPGDLRLDGITLRRTREGRLTISLPERTSSSGERHPIVRPLTPAARVELEGMILAEVRRQRGVT